MVRIVNNNTKKAISRLVTQSILDTKGIFSWIYIARLAFVISMTVAINVGIKSCSFVPIRATPHDIWLNNGKNGGNFVYKSPIKSSEKTINTSDPIQLNKNILSDARCLKEIFINCCPLYGVDISIGG